VVLVILFVPAISYYLISTGKNNFRKLAIYGPREPMPVQVVGGKDVADTIYHTVPAFSFTDHHGKVFDSSMLDTSIYIAEFFFTSCKTICPDMNRNLQSVQNKYKNDPDVKILSFTVDPETDSVPVLASYAKQHHAIDGKWFFLTGDQAKIFELARSGYFLAAVQNASGPEEFSHSEQLVLVDRDKRIRGYYDGTDDLDVSRLMDEIKVLQWEYKNL